MWDKKYIVIYKKPSYFEENGCLFYFCRDNFFLNWLLRFSFQSVACLSRFDVINYRPRFFFFAEVSELRTQPAGLACTFFVRWDCWTSSNRTSPRPQPVQLRRLPEQLELQSDTWLWFKGHRTVTPIRTRITRRLFRPGGRCRRSNPWPSRTLSETATKRIDDQR